MIHADLSLTTSIDEARTLIVVDLYDLMVTSLRSYRKLRSPETGLASGHIFGILHAIQRSLLLGFNPKHFVFVVGGVPRRKFNISKGYKHNRSKKDPALAAAWWDVLNLASMVPGTMVSNRTTEGDDVINTLVLEAYDNRQSVVILSSDQDMLGMLYSHVTVCGANGKTITHRQATTSLGYDPVPYIYMRKAICGHNADAVKGVSGITRAAWCKHMATFSNPEDLYDYIDDLPVRHQVRLLDHEDTVRDNFKLTRPRRVRYTSTRTGDFLPLVRLLRTFGCFRSLDFAKALFHISNGRVLPPRLSNS